jgi:hypothetical protein
MPRASDRCAAFIGTRPDWSRDVHPGETATSRAIVRGGMMNANAHGGIPDGTMVEVLRDAGAPNGRQLRALVAAGGSVAGAERERSQGAHGPGAGSWVGRRGTDATAVP